MKQMSVSIAVAVLAALLLALGGAAGSGEEKHASKDVNGC